MSGPIGYIVAVRFPSGGCDADAAHLEGPDMRLGLTFPRGRLVLTITELQEGTTP